MNIVDRKANLKIIERNIKNKFKWDWLQEKEEHEIFLSGYIRRVETPGTSLMDTLVDIVIQLVTLLMDSSQLTSNLDKKIGALSQLSGFFLATSISN